MTCSSISKNVPRRDWPLAHILGVKFAHTQTHHTHMHVHVCNHISNWSITQIKGVKAQQKNEHSRCHHPSQEIECYKYPRSPQPVLLFLSLFLLLFRFTALIFNTRLVLVFWILYKWNCTSMYYFVWLLLFNICLWASSMLHVAMVCLFLFHFYSSMSVYCNL